MLKGGRINYIQTEEIITFLSNVEVLKNIKTSSNLNFLFKILNVPPPTEITVTKYEDAALKKKTLTKKIQIPFDFENIPLIIYYISFYDIKNKILMPLKENN